MEIIKDTKNKKDVFANHPIVEQMEKEWPEMTT